MRRWPLIVEPLKSTPIMHRRINNLGNVLVDKGHIAEGIAAIERAIALKTSFRNSLLHLGNALRENEQLDEAIAAFDTAIKLQPDYAHAHFNRGLILPGRGDYARGWAGYEWRAQNGADVSLASRQTGAAQMGRKPTSMATRSYCTPSKVSATRSSRFVTYRQSLKKVAR